MAGRLYPTLIDGQWFRPTKRGHKHMCCDCRLVHTVDVRAVGSVEIRMRRDNRATAAARRPLKFERDT